MSRNKSLYLFKLSFEIKLASCQMHPAHENSFLVIFGVSLHPSQFKPLLGTSAVLHRFDVSFCHAKAKHVMQLLRGQFPCRPCGSLVFFSIEVGKIIPICGASPDFVK